MSTLFRDGLSVTGQNIVIGYHEIAVVLEAAGLKINPDSYHGVERLIGSELFAQLKAQHPAAFHDDPLKTLETT